MVSWDRFHASPKDGDIQGAPEVIIEVSGPSITATEITDERHVAMQTGCLQFWVIDAEPRVVRVTDSNQETIEYHESMAIFAPGTVA